MRAGQKLCVALGMMAASVLFQAKGYADSMDECLQFCHGYCDGYCGNFTFSCDAYTAYMQDGQCVGCSVSCAS